MARAAGAFLDSLSADQRTTAVRRFDDPERGRWHYWPKEDRKGLGLLAMDAAQRRLAMELLDASLSPAGYEKAAASMQLEEIIRRFEPGVALRDPLRYYFTVFGRPSDSGVWGLSVEGHHLSCNFVVENGRVTSATPLFIGANPSEVRDNGGVGPPPGTRILAREEELLFELVRSLSPAQLARALVAETSPMDMREGHLSQTPPAKPQGIPVSEFTADQKALLAAFQETATGAATPEVAAPELARLRAETDRTRFAWYGGRQPGEPHSCRIESPSGLFLLFNTQSDAAGEPANHTHLLWRTPGRDFGAGAGASAAKP